MYALAASDRSDDRRRSLRRRSACGSTSGALRRGSLRGRRSLRVGLVNGPVIAITPVFGVSIGLSQDQAAALLFALQAGSLVDAMAARLALRSVRPTLCDRGVSRRARASSRSLILWASAQGAQTS